VVLCIACVNRRFGGTPVHTRSTWRHFPEDGILHSHRCENLKSYLWLFLCGTLKNIYEQNPHSMEEYQKDIKHEISAIPLKRIWFVSEIYSHDMTHALKDRIVNSRLFNKIVKLVYDGKAGLQLLAAAEVLCKVSVVSDSVPSRATQLTQSIFRHYWNYNYEFVFVTTTDKINLKTAGYTIIKHENKLVFNPFYGPCSYSRQPLILACLSLFLLFKFVAKILFQCFRGT
jgi:hypothetical protein